MSTSADFATWVRENRLRLDLTQADLGRQVGVSAATIRKLESGIRPGSKQLRQLLVEAFEADPDVQDAFGRSARRARGSLLRANNLPMPTTVLIGREAVVDDLAALLLRPEIRLVTLTGPGGVGKTRVAQAVGTASASRFSGGVCWVSLATLTDPPLLLPLIARTLGVKAAERAELIETLIEHLRSRDLLLILDNFEQILAASPDLMTLLQSALKLKILVTSRASLRLYGEQEYPVPPLSLPVGGHPTFADFARSAAVQLFAARARSIRPDFILSQENAELIAGICTRLDGLPLAIELAAARIKLLPPPAMLARLAASPALQILTTGPLDLPARQQTLRAAIAWSYDLLDSPEQWLFRQLALFVGGWTLAAATSVAKALGGDGELQIRENYDLFVMSLLESLLDKNLIVQLEAVGDTPRFSMLETIHDFAKEQLKISGELDQSYKAYTRYFIDLAHQMNVGLKEAEQATWLATGEAEHPNYRATLDYVIGIGEVVDAAQLATDLWPFWWRHNHYTEGYTYLRAILAKRNSLDLVQQANILNALGILAMGDSQRDQKVGFLTEALALRRQIGDPARLAQALGNLALILSDQQQQDVAIPLYEESLELYRRIGDQWACATVLGNLGGALADSEPDAARNYIEQSLTLQEELGDLYGIALAHLNLGDISRIAKRLTEAQSSYIRAYRLYEGLGDRRGMVTCAYPLVATLIEENRLPDAGLILGATETLAEQNQINAPFDPILLDQATADVNAEAWLSSYSTGRTISVKEALIRTGHLSN